MPVSGLAPAKYMAILHGVLTDSDRPGTFRSHPEMLSSFSRVHTTYTGREGGGVNGNRTLFFKYVDYEYDALYFHTG